MEVLESIVRHEFARFPGVKIHYVEAGWENEDTVLLLHGFPDFWYSWRYQIPALAGRFRVVAMDQRGYNLSSKPGPVHDYSIAALVDDVRRMVKHVGKSRVLLVGHDWGGAVAWEVARRFPEMLEHLVILNCPPVDVLLAEQARNPRQLLSSYYMYLFQLPWIPERFLGHDACSPLLKLLKGMIPGISREELDEYRKAFTIEGSLSAGINYYRFAMRSTLKRLFRDRRAPPPVQVPTGVIWGIHDRVLQPSLVARLKDACVNEPLVHLVNAGHFVHQEKPVLVNKILIDMISARDAL